MEKTRCPHFVGRDPDSCSLCGFPLDQHGDGDEECPTGAASPSECRMLRQRSGTPDERCPVHDQREQG